MPFTDDQIRQAVLNLFKKYDKDNSGYVQNQEIPAMCNDLANELVTKKNYSKDQVSKIMATIDKNQDGRLSLDQVYVLMRKLNP